MSDLFWLTDDQMKRLRPFFPNSYGKPRVDDRRVLSGIIFVNRNGLRWRDAPREYGPHKTLYNRWKRWGDMGIFMRMMDGLSAEKAEPQTIMIDATYLKAHHKASSLRLKKGIRPCIPGRRSRGKPIRYDKRKYKGRNRHLLAMRPEPKKRMYSSHTDCVPTSYFDVLLHAKSLSGQSLRFIESLLSCGHNLWHRAELLSVHRVFLCGGQQLGTSPGGEQRFRTNSSD